MITQSGPPGDEKSLGQLVSDLSEQAARLVRAEIDLAKAEITGRAQQLGIGAALVAVGAVLALYLIAAGIALAAELAVTRAQLASTVDELVARLDPRAQAGRAVESGRQLWTDATSGDADPDARKKALSILGGAVAGAAMLLALIIAANRR